MLGRTAKRMGNSRTNRDHLNYSIVKITFEYCVESWRPEGTSCHTDSRERPDVRNS